MLFTVAFTLAVASAVSHAQQTNNTQLAIEAIEANFNNSGIVPSLLKEFSPTALLTINYNGVGDVEAGKALTVDQVKPTPSLTLTPANSSITFSGKYTLAMVDADIVGADESQQTRHWLANGVTITGNAVAFGQAVNITDYASPLPADGSGPHRYVILLYTQPDSFAPTGDLAQPNQPVAKYDFNGYVTSSKLGSLVAATYYTVEQGTASMSISATSAVVTSTLPAAAAAAATATGPSSGSSGSAPGSAASPTPSGKSGASMVTVNVGLMGLLAFVGLILPL